MRTLVAINNTAPRQSIDAWTTQKSITRVIFSGKGRMCGPATDDPKVAGGAQPARPGATVMNTPALPDLGRRAWCYRRIVTVAGDPLAAPAA